MENNVDSFSVSSNPKYDILCNQSKGLLNLPLGVKKSRASTKVGVRDGVKGSPRFLENHLLYCVKISDL